MWAEKSRQMIIYLYVEVPCAFPALTLQFSCWPVLESCLRRKTVVSLRQQQSRRSRFSSFCEVHPAKMIYKKISFVNSQKYYNFKKRSNNLSLVSNASIK